MPEVGTQVYLGNTEINAAGLYFSDNLVSINSFITPAGPTYVTNGLVLYMDSTVAASYPGSGTSWYNLVPGYPYTGSLAANASYVAPYLQTAASSGYINLTTDSWYSVPYTVMSATRYIAGSHQRMLAGANNWLLGQWSGTTENYYAEGSIALGSGPDDTNWRIYAGTGDQASDRYSFFLNGALTISGSTGGSGGPDKLAAGGGYNGGEPSDGQVCFVMVYNRILSEAEVLQNYNALKSKVGL
jgi:hypothetical protein